MITAHNTNIHTGPIPIKTRKIRDNKLVIETCFYLVDSKQMVITFIVQMAKFVEHTIGQQDRFRIVNMECGGDNTLWDANASQYKMDIGTAIVTDHVCIRSKAMFAENDNTT